VGVCGGDFHRPRIPRVNKGDRLTGESVTSQGVWRCVAKYSDVAPHDLTKLALKAAPNSIRSSFPSATPR
jgi:hypothetical protein